MLVVQASSTGPFYWLPEDVMNVVYIFFKHCWLWLWKCNLLNCWSILVHTLVALFWTKTSNHCKPQTTTLLSVVTASTVLPATAMLQLTVVSWFAFGFSTIVNVHTFQNVSLHRVAHASVPCSCGSFLYFFISSLDCFSQDLGISEQDCWEGSH